MDELVSVKDFKEQELKFLHSVRRLSKKCQDYEKGTYSSLDPISSVLDDLKQVELASISILAKHIGFFEKLDIFCVISKEVATLLQDSKLIAAYEQLLNNATNIILNTNVVLFRTGDISLVEGTIQIYQRLTIFESFSDLGNISNGFIKLRKIISSFENQFFAKYKLLNNNNLIFDKVYNLLSHSKDKITVPKFNVINIENHTPFKLNKNKFYDDNLLVDLAQLNTGELAILRINSGRLPKIFKSSKDLLNELINKNYYLLKVGRTLLFKTLRPSDLKLIRFSGTSVELQTTTANNVNLKMVCMDPLKWPTLWKPYFEKQFNGENSNIRYINKMRSFDTLPRDTNKLVNGLSEFVSDGEPSQHSTFEKKPIGDIPQLLEEPSLCESELSQQPSLRDIESLSYEKLIELDQSIEMSLSPKNPQLSPKFSQLRSESQVFSVDEIVTNEQPDSPQGLFFSRTSDRNSNSTVHENEDDLESVISSELDNDTTVVKVSSNSIFNPSADSYKPKLLNPASSSLLSLFTNRSKPNLSIDTFESENISIFTNTSTSESNTPQSAVSAYHTPIKERKDVTVPKDIDLSNILIEQVSTKVTRWSGKDWTILGHSNLHLVISQVPGKHTVLTAFTDDSKTRCVFIVKISHAWKCFRSTAQDIQMKIPPSDFMISAMDVKDTIETISVRCVKIDNFMNTLLHCVNGVVPVSLSSSSTIRTLSTTTSSCFSDNLQRSSTYQSELITDNNQGTAKEISQLLLLAAVKAKRHENIQKKWVLKDVGSLDIISLESQSLRTGITFEFVKTTSSERMTNDKQTYSNELGKIRRLGRTGIVIKQDFKDQLFEFTNQLVAEQVYKLIQGI
ncbi:similar to Saccharomyces cerevisiae YJR030C Putative protein of unknown function [Maudiozyma saulgeensis]|uniref:Uncharacterized protein n=1 Tax=Maudiozyma saulgeensis TaxID=1789683 RepID=A0A1X7R6S9_9SACH|nr:similar to Saccharomyces cerevisiae YJR030C Putative protein of unknown function [Kazachstania saulgeensis]